MKFIRSFRDPNWYAVEMSTPEPFNPFDRQDRPEPEPEDWDDEE